MVKKNITVTTHSSESPSVEKARSSETEFLCSQSKDCIRRNIGWGENKHQVLGSEEKYASQSGRWKKVAVRQAGGAAGKARSEVG